VARIDWMHVLTITATLILTGSAMYILLTI